MATPQEKLAESLAVLKKLQDEGLVAINTKNMTRTHRERLVKSGFMKEVMKGWYFPSRPDEPAGESTAWYASFWGFCADYLNARFGDQWCLSPEQSLSLHSGNWNVPGQLIVRTPKGGNKPTSLLHNTSIMDLRLKLPDRNDMEIKENVHMMTLPAALISCSPGYYSNHTVDARAVLSMISDGSEVFHKLLEGGHSTIAGRLAGAFRNIGKNTIADNIIDAMKAAGYIITEEDPFSEKYAIRMRSRLKKKILVQNQGVSEFKTGGIPEVCRGFSTRTNTEFGTKDFFEVASRDRELSPYANRMRMDWAAMRAVVLANFPQVPAIRQNSDDYLKQVDDIYLTDAYHSLSIEGYRVSEELIERVRSGKWDPETHRKDKEYADALAARGYWQAFKAVKKSLGKVLTGNAPGNVAADDHAKWYRELFAPSVNAGLISASDLAGYRRQPVYIRQSMHVPPRYEAVRDLMPAFFTLLNDEEDPAVRAVLGHFFFVYIHPYSDGNGRMGRFLMNVMLAAGGYPWTVIPLETRNRYMACLEEASVRKNIEPFSGFLAELVQKGMKL